MNCVLRLGAISCIPPVLAGLLSIASLPAMAAVAAGNTTTPATAPVATFTIEEFRVEGNTVLPGPMIEEALFPFLGPDRTAADVDKARAALDALYLAHDYPTVSAEIPLQDPSDGIIILKVVERTVGRLRVNGARYFSPRDIARGAPALAEGKTPNLNEVQKNIVALNQWPDRTVTPVLRPGDEPGTVDVDLNVKDNLPLHGSVELNNKQLKDTTRLRSIMSMSYNNLWQRGDSISLSWQTAPDHGSQSGILSASYLFRIPDSTTTILLSLVKSDSSVATVGSTDVIGKGVIAGARVQKPLIQNAGFNSNVSVGFDYKVFNDATVLGSDRSPSPVTYMPFNATWTAGWTTKEAETSLSATAVLGTRGIGSSSTAFDVKRYQARPNFAYVRMEASRTQTLPLDFQIHARVNGQMAPVPLISSEQFGIGGADTIRGYYESEALGDYGGSIRLELRSPGAGGAIPHVNELRGFLFADAGAVAIHDPLPGQQGNRGLASVGGGIRLTALDYLNADVTGAFVPVPGAYSRADSARLLFRVNGGF